MIGYKKIVIVCLLFVGSALIGCAKNRDQSSDDSIPQSLSFIPQSGTPLTPHDWDDIKSAIANNSSERPSSFLIQSKDATMRARQQQLLNRQSEEYKTALRNAANVCTINQPLKQDLQTINLDAGQDRGAFSVTASIAGAPCPESYSSAMRVDTDVLNVDKNSRTALITVNLTYKDSEAVTDSALQTYGNFLNGKNTATGAFRVKYSAVNGSRVYGIMGVNTSTVTAKDKALQATGTVEFLVSESSSQTPSSINVTGGQVIVQLQIKGLGKPIALSAYADQLSRQTGVFKVFINGQKLDGDMAVALLKAAGPTISGNASANADGTITVQDFASGAFSSN